METSAQYVSDIAMNSSVMLAMEVEWGSGMDTSIAVTHVRNVFQGVLLNIHLALLHSKNTRDDH